MNNIDSIKMVRSIRDKHYEETKNMSLKEKLEYYKKKATKLITEQTRI